MDPPQSSWSVFPWLHAAWLLSSRMPPEAEANVLWLRMGGRPAAPHTRGSSSCDFLAAHSTHSYLLPDYVLTAVRTQGKGRSTPRGRASRGNSSSLRWSRTLTPLIVRATVRGESGRLHCANQETVGQRGNGKGCVLSPCPMPGTWHTLTLWTERPSPQGDVDDRVNCSNLGLSPTFPASSITLVWNFFLVGANTLLL